MSLDEKRTQAASALRMISNTGDEYGKVGRLNAAGTDYDWDVPGKPGFVYCRIEREGTTEPGICIPFVALEPEVRIAFWNVNGVLIAVRPDFLDAVNLLGVLAPSLMVPMLPASGRGGIGDLTPATNSVIAGDGQGWVSTPLLTLLTAIGFLSGHIIRDGGAAMTQRAALNFIDGAGIAITGTDDSGNNETEIAVAISTSGLSDIGTPASGDLLWIYDVSTSLIKSVEASQFGAGGGGSTPDFDEDDTDDLNFTSTTPAAGANPASIVFTAPASGMVIITVTALVASEVATHLAVLSYEVREGNVVGSGTVVKAAHENYGIVAGRAVVTGGADFGSGSNRTLVSGLTPSDEYNVQTLRWVSSGSGQGDVYYRALLVEYV